MPPQRAGPKRLVPDQRPGPKPKPSLSHLLQRMLTGFAIHRQMTSAVAKAAQVARARRAMGVARVIRAHGRDVGREVLWSGGLSHLKVGPQLVEVIVTGIGMMMIPASGGDLLCHQKWLATTAFARVAPSFGHSAPSEGEHPQPCFKNCI